MDDSANQGFEETFHEYWEKVFAVIYRLVGDAPEAEALALEVFWQYYQQPRKIEDPARLQAWLYRVATNLGYNALRSQKRREVYEKEAGAAAFEAEPLGDPPTEALRQEKKALVRETLRRMNPKAARILIVRHAGLSYKEVAAALKLNPGSVGKMISRAEDEFSRLYKELEGGNEDAFEEG